MLLELVTVRTHDEVELDGALYAVPTSVKRKGACLVLHGLLPQRMRLGSRQSFSRAPITTSTAGTKCCGTVSRGGLQHRTVNETPWQAI